jgi:hypothetical protein
MNFLETIAEIHKIKSKLAKFDHIMLDKSKSVFHLKDARTFIKNSGAEVQKETMVSPITSGEILNFFATDTLQITK